jgi:hypothetical protein
MPSDAQASEVAATLHRMSSAWRERRYDDLALLFDEHIVFALPGFAERLEGRAATVDSYREFMNRVTLTEHWESVPDITVWGDTSVAIYRWEMRWLSGGVANHGAGHDVFVLRAAPDAPAGWRAVWRTMTFEPAPPLAGGDGHAG